MKKLLLAIFALTISFATLTAQERAIDKSALPKKAQTFISTHFAKDKISIATAEKDGFGKEYKVILTSGTKIEFDTKGEWKDIECKRNNSVPKAIVPTNVAQYVKSKFPSNHIVSIEQDRRGVDVELNNGVDLEFNSKGQLIKMDR
ncbi:MAG: PepSY-like domain-containing protein [Rikenellaceae bacterium]